MACLNISIPSVWSSLKLPLLICPKGLIRNNPSFDYYRPASLKLNLNLNLGCKREQHWSTNPPVIISRRGRRIGLSRWRVEETAPGPSSNEEDEDDEKWVCLFFEVHDWETSFVVCKVIRDVYKQCHVLGIHRRPSDDENSVKRIIEMLGRWKPKLELIVNGLRDGTKAKVASDTCQLLGIPCVNSTSINEVVQNISSLLQLPPPPQQYVETKAQFFINLLISRHKASRT